MRKRGTGTISKQSGYKFITVNGVQIQEHRYVMEQYLGRKILKSELVHHKNHNKLDNRVENLEIVTRSQHKKIHNNTGKNTRFKAIYVLNNEKVLELYNKYKNTKKIASMFKCSEITIRRLLTKAIGKPLREYSKERGWKYGWR